MAQRLAGKAVVDRIAEDLQTRTAALARDGRVPVLAILRVGERPDDLSYERTAIKRATSLGIETESIVLAADASHDDIAAAIDRINADADICGCLMLRPLPDGVDEQALADMLDTAKDIDGISSSALASVFMDFDEGFAPCTAGACLEMLDHYEIPVQGKHIVVVGRSLVIGKPVAMMLLRRNATVTLCHSKTDDLAAVMRAADIVICATGRARMFGPEHFSAGQTVLDVGINFTEDGEMCGDVDYDAVESIVGAITPVPGGIGSVTTSVLMSHAVTAAERKCDAPHDQ